MDPDKWEACDPNDSSGVMISNLPLLFVGGNPTALKLMSVEDFEKFIPFMVRCSIGEAKTVPWSELPKPPWWPVRLPFRIPSANSSCNKTIMIRIIERCYSYHGCPYLLQFCSSLIDVMPSCGYRFTDNRDGTSSMYHGATGKLLVAFRNENRDYDKVPDPEKTPQKKLISSLHHGKEKKNFMVQPPISDIYLCDKCDEDFITLQEVQVHEKQCEGNFSVALPSPSPEPEFIEDIINADEQVPFLSRLGLQPTKHSGIEPYVSPQKQQRLRKTVSYNHFRFNTIDVCSPFGRQILTRLRDYGKLQLAQHSVMRYEKYIHAPLQEYEGTRKRHSNRWIVTFRRKRKHRCWSHLMCFTREQKDERRRTIATGLNYRSRCLLPKCKHLDIKVRRLHPNVFQRWNKPNEVIIPFPLIDLSSTSDELESSIKSVKAVTNGNIIKIPLNDPLALPSTSKDRLVSDACQRVLNCKTVTVTRLCRPIGQLSPSKEMKMVNGDLSVEQKKISSYKKRPIEVIDLLSDDDDANNSGALSSPGKSSYVNGNISKNGHSHWSPKNSLELGRSSRVLANGSVSNLLSPNSEKPLSQEENEQTMNKENFKSDVDGSELKHPNVVYDSSDDLHACQSNIDGKLMKRLRSEVLRLKSDECRELNQKGLDLLHDFNGCSKKILTRHLAKKKLPTLTTRNSQFVIKPLLKTQLIFDTLHKPDKLTKNVSPAKATLDENGNSKPFAFAKVAKSEKKQVGVVKRPPRHSYGRTMPKKQRLLKELLSLSQDECKEIRCKGFHPADVIRVVNDIQCQDSSKSLHSVLLNKPSSYYLSTRKLYTKLNVMALDRNLSESNLLSNTSETRSLEKDNIYRRLYLLNDPKYASNVDDIVNWNHASMGNHAEPPIQKENPRRTHRQLIQSQSGMCVLSYHLPQFT